jgi:hypothetical protein
MASMITQNILRKTMDYTLSTIWNYLIHTRSSHKRSITKIVEKAGALHGRAFLYKADRSTAKYMGDETDDGKTDVTFMAVSALSGANTTAATGRVHEGLINLQRKRVKKLVPLLIVTVIIGVLTHTMQLSAAAIVASAMYYNFNTQPLLALSSFSMLVAYSWKFKAIYLIDIIARLAKIRTDVIYYKAIITTASVFAGL